MSAGSACRRVHRVPDMIIGGTDKEGASNGWQAATIGIAYYLEGNDNLNARRQIFP